MRRIGLLISSLLAASTLFAAAHAFANEPRQSTLPDLRPAEHPPMRAVKKIDKQFIGAAPGLDDGSDRSVKLQLPILGESAV